LRIAKKSTTGETFHKSDLPTEVFNAMSSLVERKDVWIRLMDISRKCFGFFTKTSTRSIEYPWVFDQLTRLKRDARILDIGAGISPLPIALKQSEKVVETIDSHPIIWQVNPKNNWNEWGFLDYKNIDPKIQSFNEDVTRFTPVAPYDAIYSISVIEHMPRSEWEKTLKLTSSWLKPEGQLILTLDLIPNTDDLWNRSEGKTVDTDSEHGTLADIHKTLSEVGYAIQDSFVKREIPYSKTDVAFLICQLSPIIT